MSYLLRKPQSHEVSNGVKLVHEVTTSNSDLTYVEFKVLDLASGSSYTEELKKTRNLYCGGNGENYSDRS